MTREVAERPDFMAVTRGTAELSRNLQNVYEELSWLEYVMYNPDYM